MSKKEEMKLTLKRDKDCKHSIRYSTLIEETGQTFSIYVPKKLLSNPIPSGIEITIREVA